MYHSRNTPNGGVAVFGGDVVVSGSLRARQIHVTNHKYNAGNNNLTYIPFVIDLGGGSPSAITQMIAPFSGELKVVKVRAAAGPAGSTAVGFHKNSNTNAFINTTASATVTVDISANDTSYDFEFLSNNTFSDGEVVGISINPTGTPTDVIVTCIWEYETY